MSESLPGAVLTRISEVRDTPASCVGESEGSRVMWARVARFEGDPGSIDARIERLRAAIESGDVPVGLAEAKLLMLVDRASGDMLGVTLFDSEEALRKGDEAMNAGPGNAGSRASVDFYEVPLHTL